VGVTVGADADVDVVEDVLVELGGIRDVLEEVSIIALRKICSTYEVVDVVEATDEEEVLLVVEPVELEEEWVLVDVLVVDGSPKGSETAVESPVIMLLIAPPGPTFEAVVEVVGLLPPLVLI